MISLKAHVAQPRPRLVVEAHHGRAGASLTRYTKSEVVSQTSRHRAALSITLIYKTRKKHSARKEPPHLPVFTSCYPPLVFSHLSPFLLLPFPLCIVECLQVNALGIPSGHDMPTASTTAEQVFYGWIRTSSTSKLYHSRFYDAKTLEVLRHPRAE